MILTCFLLRILGTRHVTASSFTCIGHCVVLLKIILLILACFIDFGLPDVASNAYQIKFVNAKI